jgi:hypothetical protein
MIASVIELIAGDQGTDPIGSFKDCWTDGDLLDFRGEKRRTTDGCRKRCVQPQVGIVGERNPVGEEISILDEATDLVPSQKTQRDEIQLLASACSSD